ncbi:MAG: S46 family peptidase [Bacteroidales bacterium]|nr:S46 family peptidase [Bacteroidales bacterium]
MKRIFTSLLLAATLAFPAAADEGMWLLPLLESMNIDIMAAEGCRLTADQIYSVNHSSLKDAIVQFDNGCTAEMISKKGLLITNHHCGYSRIQELSTPEHNYLRDGFWAVKRSQELPCPGLTVKFLHRLIDATDAVRELLEAGKEMSAVEGWLVNSYEKDFDYEQVELVSFYNDNVYYLISYIEYRDVRLVGTPPAAVGKFGGETDNWMWPRHTGDFSMFRIYADKKGAPADYSAKNVPLRPKQHLKVSLKGVKENDFAMVMGYPGSTERFMTAVQLEDMEAKQDVTIAARVLREGIMWEAMCADPTVQLQYADKFASSSNYRKNFQGMKQSFKKLDIINRARAKEAAFMDWVAEDPARVEKYGAAIGQIAENTKAAAQVSHDFTVAYESLWNTELPLTLSFGFANAYMEVLQETSSREKAAEAGLKAYDKAYKDYNEALDRKETVALLGFYRDNQNPELLPQLDSLAEGFDTFATMDLQAYTDYLFEKSIFTSREKLEKSLESEEFLGTLFTDPAFKLALTTYQQVFTLYSQMMMFEEAGKEANKAYTAGQLEWMAGQPSYPDANFTMRLSYGQVLPYSPKDGLVYNYFTTTDGILEKENPDDPEFIVPAKLKELILKKDFGRYADPADGKLHVCFLTNNDITGGNSGSPVMDGDGNLIGLAFDGNWEAMSSDVLFEPELQRCICVDIRYVLFCIDKLGGAGSLLKEMTLVK